MFNRDKDFKNFRTNFVIHVITFWSFIIILRLIMLQVGKHPEYVKIAAEKQQLKESLSAPRGAIYDRNMWQLATDMALYTVFADTGMIKSSETRKFVEELVDALEPPRRDVKSERPRNDVNSELSRNDGLQKLASILKQPAQYIEGMTKERTESGYRELIKELKETQKLSRQDIKTKLSQEKSRQEKIAQQLAATLKLPVQDIEKLLRERLDFRHKEIAKQLSPFLEMTPRSIESKLKNPSAPRQEALKRKVIPEMGREIAALKIAGVYPREDRVRVYNYNDLACHVLGFINEDGKAEGLEQYYDGELAGKDGKRSSNIDRWRRPFKVTEDIPPVHGKSLKLTLDRDIQYAVDRELAEGVKKAKARAGTAIVLESESGRILALSNYPRFDCNQYNKYDAESRRNRAVTEIFDPGSTFKIITVASALNKNPGISNQMINCAPFTVGGYVIRDDHGGYGALSVRQILEKSSNVGAARLGESLGARNFSDAIHNFGFGERTGIELPGESRGIVPSLNHWSRLTTAKVSYGYSIGVTPMQMISAVNVIANKGKWVRPFIVDQIFDEQGYSESTPIIDREVLQNERIAENIAGMLEGVILSGTGKKAALSGYRAAGKTGTAQKLIFDPTHSTKSRYAGNQHMASFIGFAPMPTPRVTILVLLDSPREGYYGGTVSAPIFNKIAQEVLLLMDVAPDQPLSLPKSANIIANNSSEKAPSDFLSAQKWIAERGARVEERKDNIATFILPDFRGMSKRKVLEQCQEMGIYMQTRGAGFAILQAPEPGARMARGETCAVAFAKSSTKRDFSASAENQETTRFADAGRTRRGQTQ